MGRLRRLRGSIVTSGEYSNLAAPLEIMDGLHRPGGTVCVIPTRFGTQPAVECWWVMQPTWQRFRIDGREFEWSVSEGRPRRLEVRSASGEYHVACHVLDNDKGDERNEIARSKVLAPTILGREFPRGSRLDAVPVSLDGSCETAKHGLIHTEFVRSLLGRWESRSRYKLSAV